MADPAVTAAAAEFLYREARLLDARSFGAWLDLFAEDTIFWLRGLDVRHGRALQAANGPTRLTQNS